MPILYASHDDGTLYPEDAIDDPTHFDKYEVPEQVTLSAEELTYGHGQIVEILVRAGKAVRK